MIGWCFAALVTGSFVYCCLVIIAARRYRSVRPPALTNPQPISILKPLAGLDLDLESNLRTFFEQDYPAPFEILFALRTEADPAVPVVHRLQAEYPNVPSRLLITGEPPYANAKVWSLTKMTDAAQYELLAMSDSDIRVTLGFLTTLAAEFQDPALDLTTCPYRAVPGPSFWSTLEAIGMNTEFLSGVLVARMLDGMKFAVGPTIVARRSALHKIGGWDRVKDYLAEDFVLGQFAAEAGCGVALSSYVIEHHIGSAPLKPNFAHRLRWCRSTRRSRPAGYVGQLFTNPLPLILALWIAAPAWWPLCLIALFARIAAAVEVAHKTLNDPLSRRRWYLLPFEDMLSFGFWVAGFFGNTIIWRGRRYFLHRDGRFTLVRTAVLLAAVIGFAGAQTPAPVQKESIVVTGTYEPVDLDESDRPVERRQVRGENALVGNSAIDFLNRDASVDLRQRGVNNIQTDISIRGSTFGQTLVLLNGMRLNDAQSGHHNADLPVPVEAIERIEILKGSGSTLYGADAVGGVVHFVTRPPESSEIRLRSAFGSFGTNQQRVSAAYARTGFSQQLSAWRDFSTGFIPNRDYRNSALSSQTNFTTKLGVTDIILAGADRPFGAEQFYGNYNSWERTKTWFASIHQTVGERTSLGFAYRRHTDLFVLYRDRPQVFTNRHLSESWQFNFRRREPLSQNATLHWGAEGLRDAISSTNLGYHDRARAAGYAALDVRALRRFSFSLGLRDEILRSADHQVLPTLAAGAWINSRLKFRGSVSRAFRLPTFTDLYYQDPGNRGSPDLRPERALSYEAGADLHASSRIRASVTVFHRRETDGIDFVRRTTADLWRATNFNKIRYTGFEASTGWRVHNTHLFELSYTGLHGAQAELGGLLSKYVFNYPRHQGIASWQSTLPAGLIARARLGALERYQRDPYAVFDAYLARAKGPVRPFLQLTNLSNTRYQEILGVAMPGRAVMGGVELLLTR